MFQGTSISGFLTYKAESSGVTEMADFIVKTEFVDEISSEWYLTSRNVSALLQLSVSRWDQLYINVYVYLCDSANKVVFNVEMEQP